jgi:hypothetical protein
VIVKRSTDYSTGRAIPTRSTARGTRSRAELRQVDPPGITLRFSLDPVVTPGGGVGGWEEVEHPKRVSSSQWTGTPLRTLTLGLMLDRFRGVGDNVEEVVRVLEVWGRRPGGRLRPDVLAFVWGRWSAERWVIAGLDYGEALWSADGHRRRLELTVSLLEHRAPVLGLTPAARAAPAKTSSPASKATKPSTATPAPSGRVYVVRAGDTLARIAQSQLGRAARWPEIAKLNGLRDPNRIGVGQRLRLPS